MDKIIGKDKELLDLLIGDMSILDACIYKIAFSTDSTLGIVTAELHLQLARKKPKTSIMLKFIGVNECSFYYEKNKAFYNIELLKFFKAESGFYLCIDPYGEEEIISSEDGSFILSSSVEGYFI